jgi:hypothetical protein
MTMWLSSSWPRDQAPAIAPVEPALLATLGEVASFVKRIRAYERFIPAGA